MSRQAQRQRGGGWLHDIGKYSDAYQFYIRQSGEDGIGRRGPDHSTAGAKEAMKAYGNRIADDARAMIAGELTPPPRKTSGCRRCSLAGECRPNRLEKPPSIRRWLVRQVADASDGG